MHPKERHDRPGPLAIARALAPFADFGDIVLFAQRAHRNGLTVAQAYHELTDHDDPPPAQVPLWWAK